MKFCDDCGGILVPEKEAGETQFKCRNCGRKADSDGTAMNITEERQDDDTGLIGEGDEEGLPKTDAECGECGNDEAFWWMEQTRAGDEPATRFFRCTECSHTWREYD